MNEWDDSRLPGNIVTSWDQLGRLLPTDPAAKMREWGNQGSQAWMDFRKANPKSALALSILPVSGQLSALAELNDAHQRGDLLDGGLAAAQLLPFGGLTKAGRLAVDAARMASYGKAAKAVAAGSSDMANTIQFLKDSK